MQGILSQGRIDAEKVSNAHKQLTSSYAKTEESFSEITSATDELSATTTELSATFDTTAIQINEITNNIKNISESYSILEREVNGISEFVNQQKEVSEQLHILKINAGILAARLGSQGKPFQVVAKEMDILNTSSNEYTALMINKTNDIMKQFPVLKEQIENIVDRSSLLQNSTIEQQAATTEMVSGVESIVNQTRELNSFIKQNKNEINKGLDKK